MASHSSTQDLLQASMVRLQRRMSARILGWAIIGALPPSSASIPWSSSTMAYRLMKRNGNDALSLPIAPIQSPMDGRISDIYTVVTKKFADSSGPAFDYLKKRQLSTDEFNKLLAWMVDNQATGEDGAKYYLKNNEAVWTKWVSPEAAEKIKAAIQ